MNSPIANVQTPFDDVTASKTTLQFTVWANYRGPGGTSYDFCEKDQYAPDLNAFLNLGACTEPIPNQH